MEELEKIIGYESIKAELIKIKDVLKNSEDYASFGIKPPIGVLLHGKPGVGKTLMAKALAKESGRKVFLCRKDKPASSFINEIKKTFNEAKKAAPSIVFLDDMDKFANADERYPDAEEYVTVQSCIDGIKNKDVFVIATANRINCLPQSLRRAGRFDRVIKVDTPNNRDAKKIIEHYLNKKKMIGDVDLDLITKLMRGKSCATLEAVINEAGIYAVYERSDKIMTEHILRACLHIIYKISADILGPDRIAFDISDTSSDVSKIVYHEAGHATVAEILNPGSVTLVSAYSRDGEQGGFTQCSEPNNAALYETHSNNIYNSLAGKAAIEYKFGISDIGANNDIYEAYSNIRDNITDDCLMGLQLYANRYDSEFAKQTQESVAKAELERYYLKTKKIIIDNKELFENIAKELAAKGVLTSNDIERIKQNYNNAKVNVA